MSSGQMSYDIRQNLLGGAIIRFNLAIITPIHPITISSPTTATTIQI
jgi:hypothetical protein